MITLKLTLVSLSFASFWACSSRIEYERPAKIVSGDLLNINVATAAEIERLPGIGPAKAKAIVDHRGEHGPFRRIEHLMLVEDIGQKSFIDLRPLIRVE